MFKSYLKPYVVKRLQIYLIIFIYLNIFDIFKKLNLNFFFKYSFSLDFDLPKSQKFRCRS
jgi:hypothetical protein